MEARGGGRRQGSCCPEETPGGGREPRWGAPCRKNEEQLLVQVQGQLRQGLHDLKAPVPDPHKKELPGAHTHNLQGPARGHSEVTGLVGPRQTLPLRWGSSPIVLSDRPSPRGRDSPPCHLTHNVPGGGRPQPHAVGRWEELGPGKRPQAQARQRRRGPGSSLPPAGPFTPRWGPLPSSTPVRSGQAGPPLPEGGVLKMANSSPKVGIPPKWTPSSHWALNK